DLCNPVVGDARADGLVRIAFGVVFDLEEGANTFGARDLQHVVDDVYAALGHHCHGNDLHAAGLGEINRFEHPIVRAGMALSIVVPLGPVERDADQIELGDDVNLVLEIPAVGVHRDVDAAR